MIYKFFINILLRILFVLIALNVQAQDLHQYAWKNRIMLLCTESDTSSQVNSQLEHLKNYNDQLAERKMIIFRLYEAHYYKGLESMNKLPYIRERKHCQNMQDEFQILLIGLDGGVKMHRDTITSVDFILGLIDGMPLRKAELKGNP